MPTKKPTKGVFYYYRSDGRKRGIWWYIGPDRKKYLEKTTIEAVKKTAVARTKATRAKAAKKKAAKKKTVKS